MIATDPGAAPPLPEEEREVYAFPASFAQGRLWFLDRLHPGGSAYNLSYALRINGPFEPRVFTAVLAELVERHESLRTTFASRGGEPVQLIAAELSLPCPRIDLSALPAALADVTLRRLADEEAGRPFDLARGPLLRATVLTLGGDCHAVFLSLHHIVSDAWSMGVLIAEVAALYGAFARGLPSPLPDLALQYADFSEAQRRWLEGSGGRSQLDYWRRRLAGLEPLELPADRPRPAVRSFRGATVSRQLAGDTAAALAGLARSRRTTLFTPLLAGLAVLLARFSGRGGAADLSVGTVISGRTRPETEGMIGFFVNTLVLRHRIDGEATAAATLAGVQATVLEALAHQDLPFERLVEEIAPRRDLGRTPLFDVVFSHHVGDDAGLEIPGLALEPIPAAAGTAKFDLTLHASEGGGGIVLSLEYSSDLYEEATARRLLTRLELLLAGMAASPDVRIADLPWVDDAERAEILAAGAVRREARGVRALGELFEEQARRRPEAVSLTFEGRDWSNGELEERSRRLAGYLAGMRPSPPRSPSPGLPPPAQGEGEALHPGYPQDPGPAGSAAFPSPVSGEGTGERDTPHPDTVALFCERSPEMILAILAVLRAGMAYVPLDPQLPEERLRYLLEDCGASVILKGPGVTLPGFLVALPPEGDLLVGAGLGARGDGRPARGEDIDDRTQGGSPPQAATQTRPYTKTRGEIRVLDLADLEPRLEGDAPHLPQVDPALTAYWIYTSGSTGNPKPVAVPHAQVVRLLSSSEEHFAFGPDDVWTLFHSYAFDFSLWEIWGALAYGGRLVIVPYLDSRSPEALARILGEQRVTVLNQTPSAFYQLIAHEEQARAAVGPALRWVIFGGEPLEVGRLEPWWRRHGQSPRLVNMYGITETTVHVTFHEIAPDDGRGLGTAIGRPLPDLALYVLDPAGELSAIGVPGELAVGGAGLARGYPGRPELTASRFVPDPFSGGAGARLYLSGDLGRLLADGRFEHWGRADRQVKIRGFRIEPGEIEAALTAHPQVAAAAVVARGDRLVAYTVPRDGEGPAVEELRGHLAGRLPSHMVPAAFVALPRLPLTPNGKLDAKALPDPAGERPELTASYVAPRTPQEAALAEIWAEVLGVDRVGVHDNFFALGGDSIRSLRLLTLAARRGLAFDLQQVFQHQTVAELAALATSEAAPAAAEAAPFSLVTAADRARLPEGLADAYPLTYLQRGMFFHSGFEAGSAVYHNARDTELAGPFDAAALAGSLAAMVARHPVLRTSFELARFSEPLQLVWRRIVVPFTVVDLTGLAEEEQERAVAGWLAGQRAVPFDPSHAPLARFCALVRGADRFRFAWTEHHAILDGWSVAVFLAELFETYSARVAGRPAELPPAPPNALAELVAAEREALESADQRSFWLSAVAGREVTRLPRSPSRGRPAGRGQVSVAVPLDAGVAHGIERAAALAGVPRKSVLLAAHWKVLALAGGGPEVITGFPANGRPEREGADRALGLFLNTLPLARRLPGGSFLDLARDAFAAEREILPRRLFPLAEIQRLAGGGDLFEAAFNYTHFHALEGVAKSTALSVVTDTGAAENSYTFLADFSTSLGDGGVELVLGYDSAELDEAEVALVAGWYGRVLAALAADPAADHERISLLSAEEREQLARWNATDSPYPGEEGLAALFARQAAARPEAPAVRAGEERLSYGELDRRASALAERLRRAGVQHGDRVVLSLPLSLELIVATLAVIQAGAAYVPIDAEEPEARAAFLARDSGAAVAVARGRTAAVLARTGLRLVGEDEGARDGEAARARKTRGSGDDLAYIIYTSGSTGEPKGVAVPQRAVARLVLGTDYLELGPGDRIGQAATPAFDAATLEIWGALLTGAEIVVLPRDLLLSPPRLAETLAAERPSALFLTTSLFQRIAQEIPEAFAPVGTFLFGGEAADPRAVARVLENGAPGRLLNGYGPTESTTFALWHQVTAVPDGATTVPIGRPLANTRAYVADGGLALVPPGAPGELLLGGDGLAWGYAGRPAITAERFVPDPFSGEAGERLYRTGDRVRQRADLAVEFLGRLDAQVKLRGFRIEPGEIEAALAAHPEVRAAAVAVVEAGPSDRRLAAWVEAGPAVTPEGLAVFLAGRLPPFMVPAAFAVLDRLPLGAQGKIDRRSLPPIDWQGERGGAGIALPRTPLEQIVADVWQEVLRTARVGIDDDFFALGGHSLLATEIIARLRSRLEVELPIRALFDSPTVAGLAGEIEARLGLAAGPSLPPLTAGTAKADSDLFPLSFAQQRLWLIDRLLPGGTEYNVPLAVELFGTLSVAALAGALTALVARHETLRTVYAEAGGEARQKILPASPFPLPRIDLSALGARAEETAHKLGAAWLGRPFDLARGPVFRALLLALGERHHLLAAAVHHVASDGRSLEIVLSEVAALYGAALAGTASPLPPLPIRYADYAVWQREALAGEVLEGEIDFWQGRLAGLPPVLPLPTDRPRPAVPSRRAAVVPTALPAALVEELRGLARRHGATLFMTLLAAWQTLLGRLAGESRVAVGSPTSGRTHEETEGLIGFFVNTLVLTADLGAAATFSDLIAQVRETALAAQSHQALPFEKLVEEIEPLRSLSYTPLFQVVLALYAPRREEVALDTDLVLRPVSAPTTGAKFDLTLALVDTPEAVAGSLEIAADLFDETTALRWLEQLEALLRSAAEAPGEPLAALSSLPESLRHQVMLEWGQTPAATVDFVPIHERFARQAALTPEALAVRFSGSELTYDELDALSNRLARRLAAPGIGGIGAETRVGVFMERSLEMVVALFGILKAGGAYVPLDPAWPAERVAFMLADSGARAVILEEWLADRLPESGAEAHYLDESWEALDGFSEEPPADLAGAISPARLAYLIYTSGSTGRPKGAALTHGNAAAFLDWAAAAYPSAVTAHTLAATSICFDPSVFEIFLPLSRGGSLLLVENILDLFTLAPGSGITVVNAVPSAVGEVLRTVGLPPSVVALNLVGEAIPAGLAETAAAAGGSDLRIWNLYGPSEDTTYSTRGRVEPGEAAHPIGRPIAGSRGYVLDAQGSPVSPGAAGELYLGGAGLARGYAERPDLTAARFVPDPFAELTGLPGERLYRTGDLVRHRPDGEMVFLGRIDRQVKVRGHRIELPEIEARLLAHPAVVQGTVTVRETAGGALQIVAYAVAADPAAPPSSDELTAFLGERLPQSMLPQAWVFLSELPTTPSGKLDTLALPAPDGETGPVAPPFTPPRNAAEEALAAIWKEVLGVERVSVFDNFFALGGDSIRSVRVSVLAQQRGLAFTLQDLFQHQTIAELVAQASPTSLGAPVEPTRTSPMSLLAAADWAGLPEEIEDAYPLLALQAGMLFHGGFEEGGGALYHLAHTVEIEGEIEVPALAHALTLLARRHPALRTSFDLATYSEPLQLVTREVALPLAEIDLRGLPEGECPRAVRDWLRSQAEHPFDLSCPPLLRFALLRLGPALSALGWCEHHAILDGWSVAQMLSELLALHARAEVPEPPANALRELVLLEQEAATSPEQQAYWSGRLAGLEVTRLPRFSSLGRPAGPPHQQALPVALAPETSRGLERLADSAGVPLKSVLLAAHLETLALAAGNRRVVTGLTVNGRPEIEGSERALGLFLNTVPLVRELPRASLADLVADAFEAERELLPFRRFPQAEMRRLAGGGELFEATFNYTHFHALAGSGSAAGFAVTAGESHGEISLPFVAAFDFDGSESRLKLDLHYDAARFTEEEMTAVGRWYGRLLQAFAGDPETPREAVDLLAPEERRQLLDEWNDTASPYPAEAGLAELFARQVERDPEAPAVRLGEVRLSYAELDRRAEELAQRLREAGFGRGSLAAVLLPRSIELVVAVLAAVKAGGAYLPLDPEDPEERRDFLLEDSGAQVVIGEGGVSRRGGSGWWKGGRPARAGELGEAAHEGQVAHPAAHPDLPLRRSNDTPETGEGEAPSRIDRFHIGKIGPTAFPSPVSGEGTGERAPATAGDDLAYVLYTSGSTGRPKGVAVPQRAVARLVLGTDYLQIAPGDRVAQAVNPAFDVSTFEIWGALLNGAELVVLPREVTLSAGLLGEAIAGQGITALFLTTSLFHVYAREAPGLFAPLKALLFGGEAADPQAVARVLAGAPPRRLINGYGPTESTTFATWYEAREVPAGASSLPIGRPLANTRAYAVGSGLEPLPVGAPGELALGGDGLAWGYVRRPDVTAERFVPDPFSGTPGARLYRTGDRTRQRPDGVFEYLGRLDQQVKVRGVRVELGEIEGALARHPAVRGAAALLVDTPAGPRIAAWYVPAGEPLPASELARFLADRLPAALVPEAFAALPSFPLTTNGKLDRRALPPPVWPEVPAGDGYAAPRTDLEGIVAELWQSLFASPRIGVEDDFFALGGHSLLATELAARVRRLLGVDLPIRAIFDHPTPAGLAREIERRRHRSEAPALPPLERLESIEGDLPLSFAQQRLWLIDRIAPGGSEYNVPWVVALGSEGAPLSRLGRGDGGEGLLSLQGVLAAGLSYLVERHEILRTVYAEVEGEPVQRVLPPAPVPLPEIDLGALPGDVADGEADRVMASVLGRPFDLARGPVLRAVLVALTPSVPLSRDGKGGSPPPSLYRLGFAVHHIATDGRSQEILAEELEAVCGALLAGRAPDLPPPAFRYADFAAWQRRVLAGEVLERELAFWRGHLTGITPVLPLPLDRPRPPHPGRHAGRWPVAVPADLAAGLHRLGREHGATPFLVLLAAWQLFLGRLTGENRPAVGTPVEGRLLPETRPLVGFFGNTLVLAPDVARPASFTALLAAVRDLALEAQAHQAVPFERLVEEVAPERSLSHMPLFQVLFTFAGARQTGGDGDEAPAPALPSFGAKVDLALALSGGDDGIGGILEYAAELFDPATVGRMAEGFAALLEAAVAAPETAPASLPIIPEAERHQVLREWAETAPGLGAPGLLHGAFEARAAEHPEAVALTWSGEPWTYGRLHDRAESYAAALARLGVGPEARVGLFASRRPELVAALLGVLKAGGAYVPLDPAWPRERLALMLEDCRPAVVMVDEENAGRLPASPAALLPLAGEGPAEPRSRPALSPQNLAYLIYTSGSTGRPKGVALTHANATAFLAWAAGAFPPAEREVVLASTSISFDPSIFEIFLPLGTGSRFHLVDDALALLDLPESAGVTLVNTVPSAVAEVVRSAELPKTVRAFNLVGEPIPAGLAEVIRRQAGPVRLSNLYGPTEDTTYSTWAEIEPGEAGHPIGRVVAGSRARLLDRHLEPVPVGATGELYLGGAGLARGYYARPELTAERFVPDPYAGREAPAGARLYRTGDAVRALPDGRLVFLERIDQQVKVHGFRIELGEIEAALASHPAVGEAAVVARGTAGDRALVAYVVPQPGAAPTATELRAALAERLPDYMIPGVFVTLESFPLTPSGKLDRKALPEPQRGGTGAPRDVLELELARIWEEILGVPRVGIHDDFFELGGHSLTAVRLLARIRERWGSDLPLATLFAAGTVESLAVRLREGYVSADRPILVPLTPSRPGSRPPLFFVHPAGGEVLAYAGLARGLGAEQPFYGLQRPEAAAGDSLEELAARYLEAIREVIPEGPYRLGGWSLGGVIAFEMASQLERAGVEVELLVAIDPPAVPTTGLPEGEDAVALAFAHDLAAVSGHLDSLGEIGRSRGEILPRLTFAAEAAGLLPPGQGGAEVEHRFRAFARDLTALAGYRPGTYGGRLEIFLAPSSDFTERQASWERLASRPEVQKIPGDHFSAVKEALPQLHALLDSSGPA